MPHLEKMDVAPDLYVVLDVETTGLNSKEDDLLSISIYKPDTNESLNRFLPLELRHSIPLYITNINGIRKRDLIGCKPLTQVEVNRMIEAFELHNRLILIYGNMDQRFIRDYFARHELRGYTDMKFFNFKHLISATRFSDGSLTKDNLCKAFGIEGVSDVHSGMNDCVLEWKLFQKIDGYNLLANMYPSGWTIRKLSPDYIVPVSYLTTYSNLSKLYPRPKISLDSELVYSKEIIESGISLFATNICGMTFENLVKSMLGTSPQSLNDRLFLSSNYRKNVEIVKAPHNTSFIEFRFLADGTVASVSNNGFDEKMAETLNENLAKLRDELVSVIVFVKSEIFPNGKVKAQELCIEEKLGILACCDFSDEESVLEVKKVSDFGIIKDYAEQIHYEARGRRAYLLAVCWIPKGIKINIYRLRTSEAVPNVHTPITNSELDARLQNYGCKLLERFSSEDPVLIKCLKCGYEWRISYHVATKGSPKCPKCLKRIKKKKNNDRKNENTALIEKKIENRRRQRAEKFSAKVNQLYGGAITVVENSYSGCREYVTLRCMFCGNEFKRRADHVIEKGRICRCPVCRKNERHEE